MPKRYLYIDLDSQELRAQDERPVDPYSVEYKDRRILGGFCSIWLHKQMQESTAYDVIALYMARCEIREYLSDINSIVNQLREYSSNDTVGYITIGESPKLIKWKMKIDGFNVITLSVSGIKLLASRTEDFTAYLTEKLNRLSGCGSFVIIDFADTGASLLRIKADIEELREGSKVVMVAIAYRGSIDAKFAGRENVKVIVGTDKFFLDLHRQHIKLYVTGRHKAKNDYGTWSTEKHRELYAGEPGAGDHVFFETKKPLLRRALNMVAISILLLEPDDFIDGNATQDNELDVNNNSDSDSYDVE